MKIIRALSFLVFIFSFLLVAPKSSFAVWQYTGQFGSYGTGNGQFNYPYGLDISTSTGNIYVVDAGNNRIQILNSSGTYISKFGTSGSGNGQFNYPNGIAISSITGNIYVQLVTLE